MKLLWFQAQIRWQSFFTKQWIKFTCIFVHGHKYLSSNNQYHWTNCKKILTKKCVKIRTNHTNWKETHFPLVTSIWPLMYNFTLQKSFEQCLTIIFTWWLLLAGLYVFLSHSRGHEQWLERLQLKCPYEGGKGWYK